MNHPSMDQLSAELIFKIVTKDLVQNEQDELEFTTAKIQFFLAEMRIITMDLCKPHMLTSQKYVNMTIPGKHTLVFCDSNGGVCVTRDEPTNTFKFDVFRYGCGGDGGITINIPIHVCEPLFKALSEWRLKYE